MKPSRLAVATLAMRKPPSRTAMPGANLKPCGAIAKQLVDGHDVELWQGDRQKAVQRYSLPNRCSTSPACARARAMSSSVNAALMLVQVSLNLAFASAKFLHIPMSRASCGLP